MNTFKRFFALILTLCMVLSYVPVGAFAAETRTAAEAPAGVSNATEPFPLSLMTNQGNSGGHYRIPAMITLNDGTVVAAADARWQGWDTTDDNGNIDTVVSYSKNNGETWEVGFGNYFTCSTPYAECWGSPTIIDPGLVTDGEKIYMIADLFPGQADGDGNCSANAQYAVGYDDQGRMLLRANANTNDTGYYLYEGKIYASNGTEQAGYTVDAYFNLSLNDTFVRNLFEYSTAESGGFIPVMTPHLYLTVGEFDADGDLVWSEPTMLNPVLRSASEKYYLVSPGRGIKTKDGVLVIGGYGNASGGEKASIIFFDGESWHRSSREAASVSSETEIVELADGTLRMFARHSGNGNYVQYIDWTPVYTDGKVTDYTPSAAVNTTAVAHNNTNVTAIGYSKTYGGKQVILVSCPGDTSSAWTRLNGKIFTFVVDPTTKAMTLVNTVEVNGSGEAYSYSCLTELADGTVGLLYEKGDGGNISYAEYDAEELTGLEFDGNYDIFVDGSNNLTTLTVKVPVSAGVTQIHTKVNNNVAGLTADTYVAYDIVLCKDGEADCDGTGCTATYTGVATVNLPISGELAAQNLKGFVVNGDGSFDYVMDVSVINKDGSYLATFKAPHFSTVGVMPKTLEEAATDETNVTVKVGATRVETLTGENLNGSNAGKTSAATAEVSWSTTANETTYPTAQLGTNSSFSGDIIDLNTCLYTFNKNADNTTWVISAKVGENTVYIDPHAGASNGGKPNRDTATNITLVNGTNGAIKFNESGAGYLHFRGNDNTNLYWDQCTSDDDRHNLLIYKVADTTNTNTILGGYYTQVTSVDDLVSGERYLIIAKHDNGGYYVMHPTTAGNSDKYAHLAKVTGATKTTTQYETTITIKGVAEGTTEVAVGNMLYKITVAGALTEVDVKLEVGETKNISDDTGYYKPNYTGEGLNTSVATVKVDGTTVSHDAALSSAITSASHFDGTKKYLIVCNRPAGIGGNVADADNSVLTNDLNGTGLLMNGPMSVDSTELWTIEAVTGGYVIKQGDMYLTVGYTTAGMTSTETVLSMDHSTGTGYKTGWRIFLGNNYLSDYQGASNTNAHGWNDAGDEGNYWTIYEVTPAHITGTTSIEIAGVSSGTTSVVVGNTKYNIIVGDDLTDVDVTLKIGETITVTDDTGNFENNVDRTELDTSIADVAVTGTAGTNTYQTDENAVTGTITEGTYVICIDGTSRALSTSTTEHKSGVPCLNTATSKNAVDTVRWVLVDAGTDANGNKQYYIKNGDNYLNLGTGTDRATLTQTAEKFSFIWYADSSAWAVKNEHGQYFNDLGGSHKIGGWTGDGTKFDVYPVSTTSTPGTTTIDITGKAAGETSVMVGNTRYTIEVAYREMDVTLYAGQNLTITDNTGNYADNVDRTNLDTSIADVAVTGTADTITRTRANDAASSIKNGSKYIIVNHAKNKVVTNEDASQAAAAGAMTGMKMTGNKDTFGESAVWTIEAVTGGYTVQNSNGKYLSIAHNEVSLSVAPVTLKVEKNGDTWTFGSGSVYLNDAAGGGTCATGWDNGETARTDGGSQWDLYEITETAENSTTSIQFTGVAPGETTVRVGHVIYNITVINSTIQVDMMIDDTKNFVIDGGAFDSATNSNDTVASVTVTPDPLTEDTRLRKVTDITSGRKYLIETNRGTPVLLNGTVEGTGLLLSGTKSADSAQVWTIEEFGEGYSVSIEVDGVRKYLSMTKNDEALLVDAPVALRLGKNGVLWTISQADCYLNRFGGASGTKAAAWNGGGAATDDGSMWNIYEVVNEDRTNVSIKGLTAGNTTIKVGFMTYEVTVHEKSKDITLLVGETWEGVIDGVAEESGTNSNDPSAFFATITWKGITDGVMGHLMNADGSYGNLYEMSNAELTFTKNEDGTWGIVDSTGQHFMTISGQPFSDSQSHSTAISFNEDGTARLSYSYTYDGTSYTSYLRFNTNSFQWAHNHDLNQANSIFDFLIYTPVAEGEESSAEMPGYKKVTNGDQMVSGNNYLIAFVLDGGYYCMTYNPLAGNTYGNLVRVYPTEHTDIKIVGKNVGKTSYEIGGVTYNITVNPFIKTITMEYHEENETFVSPLTGEVSDADIEQFNKTHGAYVTVEKNAKGTELIFTAKAVCDSFEHTLGNITYIIKVTPDLADPEDTDYVGGQNGSKGKNQPITGLIISTATSYDLNVDTTDMPEGTTIKWVSSDSALFEVDGNGNVTAKNTAGEGFVSVYKVDADGNETLYQTIPVIVLATEKGTNTRLIDFYNEEVLNCTSYYSLSEGELHEFPEGYQIYVRHDKSVADVISFWATPDDGYALTYINGSGGTYFHPVDAGDGINYGTNFEDPNDIPQYVGTDASSQLWAFDQLVASAVKNAGAITITEAINLTNHAVVMRADGMFFFSRAVNTGDMSSTTIFVAEKLPEVSKSINGVLNTSDPDNPWNWTTYKPGMYAEVGNKVFFTLQLEIEAPIRWERILDNAHKPIKPEISADDTVVDVEGYVLTRANENSPWVRAEYNGNPYKPAADIGNIIIIDHEGYLVKQDANGRPLAALEYNIGADDGNAELLDNLEDAYFYTKELDRVGTDYDPNATYENPNKYLDAEIPENLKTRVQDVTAAMNAGWTEAEIEAGKRVLTYYVMYAIKGKDLNKEIVNTVTLDYTHKTTYSKGATVAHADAQASIIVVGEALGDSLIDFGRPVVKTGLTNEQIPGVGVYNEETKTWSYSADRLKAVNELTQNANDSLLYGDAELTYDADAGTYTLTYTPHSILESRDVIYIMVPDGEGGAVLSNYLRVYPATTVYYEETFADLANANSGNDHGWNNVQPSTKAQEFQDLKCDEHDHSNFGFDPSYADETGMSNGTQLISKKSGDTATYQFTGTGFELYANADIDTSVLAVLLYRVNTADDGTQTETMVKFYQVVTANKSGDSAATDGQELTANSLPVVSVSDLPHASYKVVVRHTKPLTDTDDEIRIDGIRIYGTLENGDQYYPDEEQNVIFTELRDEVLTAISGVSTDNCDQVYSQIQTLGEVTVGYLTADTAEDMLKNGPKNEIWMTADDALVFKLSAGVANAQLGLKAPSGAVKCVITIAHADGKQTKIIFTDAEVEQEEDVIYIINKPLTTSTDMFYRLPGDVAGAVVTIEVNEGMLSVTKLKTKMKTNPNIKALAVMDEKSVNTALNILYGYVDENAAQNNVPAKPYDIVNVVSGVHVYWKATEGAVKYGLWRSETGENGTYKWLGNPTVPHFTDTKVESGKTYYYKVTAMDANGKHSDKSEAIGITYVATPDINTRFNKAAGITVGWNKIEGATGYAVYRKLYSGNSEWARVATIEGNETFTWQDTSVKNNNGTAYKYTVRALAGDDLKTLSGCRNAGRSMVRLTSRVLTGAVKASDTAIKCSWTTSSAVTGYEIRFMIGNEVFKTFTVGNYKTGVKTFTGLKAGQTYKVQVRSYVKIDGMGFYSAWSAPKYANTLRTLTFADIPSSYYFSSGVGAWGTGLDIKADGTMSGSFHDSNMGETGTGYPNGTVYTCSFSGKFSAPEAVNAYVYKMTLESLTTKNPAGHVEIKDGVRYVSGDAYGIDGEKVFYIYLPGTPKDMLPEDVYNWVWRSYGEDALKDSYIICGESNAHPFVS